MSMDRIRGSEESPEHGQDQVTLFLIVVSRENRNFAVAAERACSCYKAQSASNVNL